MKMRANTLQHSTKTNASRNKGFKATAVSGFRAFSWKVNPIFLLTDLLTLSVMLGTFHASASGVYRYFNQGLAIVLLLLYTMCHISLHIRIPREYVMIGLFILWSWGSGSIVAYNQYWYQSYTYMIMRYFILAVAVCGFARIRKSATMGFVILAIIAFYVNFRVRSTVNIEELLSGELRLSEFGVNPNSVGLILLWGFAAIFFLWNEFRHPVWRLILVIVGLTNFITLISTASRKSFLGFLLFSMLWALFCFARTLLVNTRSMIVILAVVLGIYYLLTSIIPGTYLAQRFETVDKTHGLDETRTGLYREAWEMFLEYPLTGVGLGNFMVHSSYQAYSHSEYAEILSTTGAVGFILYFSSYLILLRKIFRVRQNTDDPRLIYQMGVFQALFITMMAIGVGVPFFLSIYPWFLMALMIGHTTAYDQKKRKLTQKETVIDREVILQKRRKALRLSRSSGRSIS